MILPPITLLAAAICGLLYAIVFFWARRMQRLEAGRPRPFDLSALFLVLLYALELTQGSRGALYVLLGLFLFGRIVQSACVDARVPLRLGLVGGGIVALALLGEVALLALPLA